MSAYYWFSDKSVGYRPGSDANGFIVPGAPYFSNVSDVWRAAAFLFAAAGAMWLIAGFPVASFARGIGFKQP